MVMVRPPEVEMDITLLRTFLEVAATGSFVASADHLYVTQSAVSLRVRRLEDELGKPLFTRSKAGAELTAAGREFEKYALSILRVWEEARQQVAIPEGFTASLTIGAQYSLWPRLGFRWIDALQGEKPDLNIRAEVGMPDRITRFLVEGVVQAALLYTPQIRPGLTAEPVLEDELVMVATWPEPTLEEAAADYVFVDWGPEFVTAHALALEPLTNPGLTLSLGALAAEFVVNRRRAAYLPARYVKRYLDSGAMHLVPEAPHFPYPVWAVWREDLEPDLRAAASRTLGTITANAERDGEAVVDALSDISGHQAAILGSENGLLDQ